MIGSSSGPGTYDESITIEKDITLAGDGDVEDIVIRVAADAAALPDEIAPLCRMGCTGTAGAQFGIYLAETSATVSDLTILGLPFTVAVVVHGGAPTLERLVIDIEGGPARSTVDAARHGLVVDHGSAAYLRDITHEGWMTVDRGASPTIEDSDLLDTCIAIWGEGTAAVFRKNTVTACPNGFAFDVAHGAIPLIEGNDISGGQDGFPVIGVSRGTADGTHAVIKGNTIHGASDSTSGVLVEMGVHRRGRGERAVRERDGDASSGPTPRSSGIRSMTTGPESRWDWWAARPSRTTWSRATRRAC